MGRQRLLLEMELAERGMYAAFLFFNFMLSMLATYFAIRAVDEIRQKQKDEYVLCRCCWRRARRRCAQAGVVQVQQAQRAVRHVAF